MKQKEKKKGLRLIDTVALAFSAIFVLDSFSMAAAIGWQSIIYWVILAMFFFVPYGLISSELGSTYTQGGVYSWVKRAFGPKWAARTNWFYWLNVSIWMSSSYIVFASTISYIFFDGQLIVWVQVGIAIGLTIITVLIGFLKQEILKYVPLTSSVAKLLVTVLLILAMIIWLAKGNGSQTNINDPTVGIVPAWSTGLLFIPVIMYNFCGFELGSNQVENMKNPKKDIPLAALISGITIVISYILGTIAVNVLVDVGDEKYDISNGLMVAIGNALPKWLTIIAGILLIYTLFGNMMTWYVGANLGIAEAANDGEFPKVFATKLQRTNQPLGAAVITGIISIVCLLIAGISTPSSATATGDLFEALFSFMSIIFLLPYVFIFPSFLKLRKVDKDISKAFSIPGRPWFIKMITIIPMTILVTCLFLLLFGDMIIFNPQVGIQWASIGMKLGFTIGGTIVSIIVGEILIWYCSKNKNQSKEIKYNEEIK